jgi:hypothetical protein
MERSAHTCEARWKRTISLFFNIFSARCVPVGLCLTSFTRPNPPVPVSTPNQLVRGTHDVRRAGDRRDFTYLWC